jgi:hypothetical protein
VQYQDESDEVTLKRFEGRKKFGGKLGLGSH